MDSPQFVEQLKHFDMDNIGYLPRPIKIAGMVLVFVLTFLLGYAFVITSHFNQLEQIKTEEEAYKEQFLSKYKLLKDLQHYQASVKHLEENYQDVLNYLPVHSQMSNLLDTINKEGNRFGLKVKSFKPSKVSKSSLYLAQPVKIYLSGRYEQLTSFIKSLTELDYLVTVDELRLKSPKEESVDNILDIKIVVTTYQYNPEAIQPKGESET